MRHTFKFSGSQGNLRLDQALGEMLPQYSRSRLQKLIRQKMCKVNGETNTNADLRLLGGEMLELEVPESGPEVAAEAGEVKIVWQDENLAVCDKEAGLVTHPCPSCDENTLLNRLLWHFPQIGHMEGSRPGIVHRLDRDTTGLLLVALNEKTRLGLAQDFAVRKIRKQYLALVKGKPPDTGECAEPIGRHPTLKTRMAVLPEKLGGKPARSLWTRLWTSPNGNISLLSMRIFSGRTHQIRVHLAHAGFPILGDKVYAPAHVRDMAPRQMLHSWKIAFRHPLGGEELEFKASPPPDFYNAALANGFSPRSIVVTGAQGCGKSTFTRILREQGAATTSADALVTEMYAARGHIASWLENRFGEDLLNPDKTVNKNALFVLLQNSPQTRRELEQLVHAMVFEEIEKFWREQWQKHTFAAVAEIPLYFECDGDKLFRPRPFAIGLRCPKAERWRRIKTNRGWSGEKIETIEKWQMPEDRKMARCDIVIDNSGNEGDLAARAREALDKFVAETGKDKQNLLKTIKNLCEDIS